MKNIGFLGCGKIGQALLAHVKEQGYGEVIFIIYLQQVLLLC